jgi:hypothetical protein
VWQLLQPAEPVKIALPADALAPPLWLVVEVVPLGADAAAADEGGVPIGGAPLFGCLEIQAVKTDGETTLTWARMNE